MSEWVNNWTIRGTLPDWARERWRSEKRQASQNGFQPNDRSGYTGPVTFRFQHHHAGGSGGGRNQVVTNHEVEIETRHNPDGSGRGSL